MAEKVDLDKWGRRDIFKFFEKTSHPYYSVTFRFDVTELYKYVKANGLSFYYSLVYLCTEAVNMTDAFGYVIRRGEVYRIGKRKASFTDLKKGSENFHIVTMKNVGDGTLEDFVREARKKSAAQTVFIEEGEETDDLIYFSCLPWIDVTSVTNERDMSGDFPADDSIPRIAFGKYVKDGEKYTLSVSAEVNHRLIDGYHIGLLAENLKTLIEKLGN